MEIYVSFLGYIIYDVQEYVCIFMCMYMDLCIAWLHPCIVFDCD